MYVHCDVKCSNTQKMQGNVCSRQEVGELEERLMGIRYMHTIISGWEGVHNRNIGNMSMSIIGTLEIQSEDIIMLIPHCGSMGTGTGFKESTVAVPWEMCIVEKLLLFRQFSHGFSREQALALVCVMSTWPQ